MQFYVCNCQIRTTFVWQNLALKLLILKCSVPLQALESLRKTPEASSDPALLTEVELALAGLARVFSVEAGDDLSKVRLQMIGARQTLPGGHVPVTDPSGLGRLTDRLASDLGEGSLRLGHAVKHIDWSLLGGRGGVSGSGTDHSAAAGKIAVECHRSQSESAVLYMVISYKRKNTVIPPS